MAHRVRPGSFTALLAEYPKALLPAVEVFAVGLVQDVIQTGAQLDVFIHLVGGIGGKHTEAGAFGKVFAYHVAFVDRHAVLAADQTPQPGAAPVAVLIGEPQTRLQRRDLRQRPAVAGVFAP